MIISKKRRVLTLSVVVAIMIAFCGYLTINEVSAASKPAQVENLKVYGVTTSSCSLSWSKAKSAEGYKVYMKTGSGSYKLVKTTTSKSYKKTGLKSNTKYMFKVRAYKKSRSKYLYGKYSSAKSITTKQLRLTNTKHAAYANILLDAQLGTTDYVINSYITAIDKEWGEKAIVINYALNGKRGYAYVRLRAGVAEPVGDYFSVYQMDIYWLPNKYLCLNTFSYYKDLTSFADIGSAISYSDVRNEYKTAKKAKDYHIVY